MDFDIALLLQLLRRGGHRCGCGIGGQFSPPESPGNSHRSRGTQAYARIPCGLGFRGLNIDEFTKDVKPAPARVLMEQFQLRRNRVSLAFLLTAGNPCVKHRRAHLPPLFRFCWRLCHRASAACLASHDQCGRAKRSESVEIIGYRASDPNYKGRESGALQPKCNYQHQNRRAYFTKEDHGSLVCRHLGRGGDQRRSDFGPAITRRPSVPPKSASGRGSCWRERS